MRKAWNKIEFSKEDINKIINRYDILKSSRKVAEEFGISKGTVTKILKENGVKVVPKKKTEDEINNVIELYKECGSVLTVSKLTGIKIETINIILGEDKYTYYQKYEYPNVYSYNQDIFKVIDTEEKAYWLGFLYADGCILDGKGYPCSMQIGLASIDINHLYKFCDFIGCEYEIIKSYREDKVELNISNRTLCEDLISLGCIPRKSLILEPPNSEQVPDYLLKHFIRGYVDGDGTIYERSNGYLCIGAIGTPNFINFLSGYINLKTGATQTKFNYKSEFTCEWKKQGRQAIEIGTYLYKDANVYLERKYQKICPFM